MVLQPDDVIIKTSIDYLKLFIMSPSRFKLTQILKNSPGFNYVRHIVSHKNKNWQCCEYRVYLNDDIKEIYHEYSIEKQYIQLIKLSQPTLELNEYILNFMKDNGNKFKLSRIEYPFDIYPKRSGVSLKEIKKWVEMHLLQSYVPLKMKEFRYKDTFYTRRTRKLKGQASRGMKVYIKNNTFVRCELELLRPYIKRKEFEFSSVNKIELELSRNFKFVEFDKNKFNRYLTKDNIPSPFKRNVRSMMEIKRKVNEVYPGCRGYKFFKSIDEWNSMIQRVFDKSNDIK